MARGKPKDHQRKRRVRRKPRIVVVEKKLQRGLAGKGKLYGVAWTDGVVEIEPRQKPRCYLDTVIHEVLHIVLPDASETRILKSAHQITDVLWRLGYRRVIQ